MDKYLIRKNKDAGERNNKKLKEDGDEVSVNRKRVAVSSDNMFVGAHVSIAGALKNAVAEAVSIGAKSFGLFLVNQRTWNVKPLDETVAQEFVDVCQTHQFPSHVILPHGSYLMNCGSSSEETLEKSRSLLTDGLKRCEMLGIDNYNFHPGSTCGKISVKECVERIAESINIAHTKTNKSIAVLENMSKQGNTIGGDFKELRDIIDRVKDKSRVGVCLDTCHAFAAGYNLATEKGFEKMLYEFDTIIGFKYLKALHLNDSKGPLNSHLDRHENIGRGQLGIDTFKRVMNEPQFTDIPMILETPYTDGVYKKEIELLYDLIK